jgi:outer membrane protein assembly factor BamB
MPTKTWLRQTARLFLVATVAFVGLLGTGRAQEMAGNWPMYGADLAGTRTAGDESITTRNIDQLQPLWQVEVGGPVSATPVIADGIAYVGSYDGMLYAIELETGQTA